jgi:serine/tyrosine/threonine adenylyltransferase
MKIPQPYLQYPESMIQKLHLLAPNQPSLFLYVNMDLVHKLHLEDFLTQEGCEALSGFASNLDLTPLALAYAGHQFGHFTRLGDGRALVLGRVKGFDLCLKGSGPTPYARGGDGLAPLPSLIKETLYSHALTYLKIPASKVFSLTYHHKHAYRETAYPAGVLARLMRTNIRIGSIEYARTFIGEEGVKQVLSLAMSQCTPSLVNDQEGLKKFVETCVSQWGQLVALWQSIGFVHGVLNSDNVSLAYETIDFGPCAFLETVNQKQAFSSIDILNRYAYGNQKDVLKFNMNLFLEACQSLLLTYFKSEGDMKKYYHDVFDSSYDMTLGLTTSRKLGLVHPNLQLWKDWLDLCESLKLDFTQSLVSLTYDEASLRGRREAMDKWLDHRLDIVKKEGLSKEKRFEMMSQANPVIVLRHELVNSVIESALAQDFSMFDEVLALLKNPYDNNLINHPWFRPTKNKIVTTCGT